MNQFDFIDFTDCEYSERDGTYGGQAGSKDGVLYNGEYWIIKYPKSTKGMDVENLSYTTSPLSEFIGSHIYRILGYDVHETLLGFRNQKVVVACKDFSAHEGALREVRTLKNASNKELEEILETSLHSTGSEHIVDLEEILLHLKHNRILSKVEGVEERFWDCAVIDIFINNNDRNNGNWGLLYEGGNYRLAPIFDNGASFSDKMSDEKILRILADKERLIQSSISTVTGYGIHGKRLSAKQFLDLEYSGLQKAIKKNVPFIEQCLEEIEEFLSHIPESRNGYEIMTPQRKQFYISGMQIRLEKMLIPKYEQIRKQEQKIENHKAATR